MIRPKNKGTSSRKGAVADSVLCRYIQADEFDLGNSTATVRTIDAQTINCATLNATTLNGSLAGGGSSSGIIKIPTVTVNVQDPVTTSSSAIGSGLVMNDYSGTNGSTLNTGYIKAGGTSTATTLTFKAPGTAGVATMTPGSSSSNVVLETVSGTDKSATITGGTGGILTVGSTKVSTSFDSGALVVSGGIGVKDNSTITTGSTATLTVGSSKGSTATNSGALVVSGGAGVGENLYVGGNTDLAGTLSMKSNLTIKNTSDITKFTVDPANNAVTLGTGVKLVVDSIQASGNAGGTTNGTLNIGTDPDVATINIGNPNVAGTRGTGTTINIGGANDTVVLSNVVNVTSSNTQIEQTSVELGVIVPTPTANQNTNAVGQGLIFDAYETSTTPSQGYFQVSGSNPGTSFTFKAPKATSTGLITLTPGTVNASIITDTTAAQTLRGAVTVSGALASTGGTTVTATDAPDSDATTITGSNSTRAQSASYGSLQVTGGLGVSKSVFIGATDDSSRQNGTSYGTGALAVRGGAYVAKILRLGGGLNDQIESGSGQSGLMINNTMDSTTTANAQTNMLGALTCRGGAYVSKFLQIGGAQGDTTAGTSGIKVNDSTGATSSAGAIQTNGGVRALNLYLSQADTNTNTNPPYNNVATGYTPSIVTEGGAWIKKNLSIGTTVSASNDQGNIYVTNDIAGFSDARLKRDVVTIPGALEKVGRMRGVYYKKLVDDAPTRVGLIAQEVREVVPEAVVEVDGYLSVTYQNLVGLLVEAVKDLKAQNEDLKARLEALEAR